MIIHDRDLRYTKDFTQPTKRRWHKNESATRRLANLNGRCERFIGTIRWECLDKFIIFGKRHLDYLPSEFTGYYKYHRALIEREYLPPVCSTDPVQVETLKLPEVGVKSHVSGLVKSFERKAA